MLTSSLSKLYCPFVGVAFSRYGAIDYTQITTSFFVKNENLRLLKIKAANILVWEKSLNLIIYDFKSDLVIVLVLPVAKCYLMWT